MKLAGGRSCRAVCFLLPLKADAAELIIRMNTGMFM